MLQCLWHLPILHFGGILLMANINYERLSPNEDADATQRRQALEESLRGQLFPDPNVDTNALAEVTISSEGNKEITCSVSDSEGCIIFSPTRMQISKNSPVGNFIAQNLKNLQVGTKLPNGSTIIKIGYIRSAE
jgi:hypothetical protein